MGRARSAFYTSGQLFIEEYYTQGVIAHGAIGTNHVDGNTRLCTATAGEALKESFGCDGQPGSYTDVDHCDTIALYGHNVAETQTVLWMRTLDRLTGTDPPALLCVDPRPMHRDAAGVSLDWELLAQGAQATKDDELLELTKRCHPQTLRQMRWANAMLKELSPQALSG